MTSLTGKSTKWNRKHDASALCPLGFKCSIINTFLCHTTSTALLSRVSFGYYGDRSGSRWGQEGLLETEAEREREECDSD